MTAVTHPKMLEAAPAERAARLLAEARVAARDQVRLVEQAIDATARLSAQVADGGDIYPPGVRELCRRMAADAELHSKTLGALATRLF